jgi:uncharacterized protein (DUF58 family)
VSADDRTASLTRLVPPSLHALLSARDLKIERPVLGRRHGRHRSLRAGAGHEFRDHRPYTPGDDPRRLDWRAAARRDALVLRQAQAEQELSLALLLDAGGGMDYGSGDTHKWTLAASLAGALAWLVRRQGDRLGFAWGASDAGDVSALRPSASSARFEALARQLGAPALAGRWAWPELLGAAGPRLPARSLVVVLSDLWDLRDRDELDADVARDRFVGALGRLRARGHDIVAVQIVHRDELEFPWTGRRVLRFEDLRGVTPPIEGPGGALRDAYRARVSTYVEGLDAGCERQGVRLIRLVTDIGPADGLLAVLDRVAGERTADAPEMVR